MNKNKESPAGASSRPQKQLKMELMVIDKESSGSETRAKENDSHLRAVAPEESGQGLPYAPVDWPKPGDTWSWKVGRRVAITGHFLDRYLYPPKRLQQIKHTLCKKTGGFASKTSVEQFIRSAFPDADIDSFFASFSWKIPSKQSSVHGNREGRFVFPLPMGETAEDSGSDSQSDGVVCKAGNKTCNSLVVQAENPPLTAMTCDICCTESRFCRDCCCILCTKSVNSQYGGYSYIKCEAVISEDYICGHVAHINCALRIYLAGTVGGSIGLDAEYYCRRCDAKTDLVPHVMRLLETCKSIDSHDEMESMLNIGVCILRGSQKDVAKRLLNCIELAIRKLRGGAVLEDIWKVDEDNSTACTGGPPNGIATLGVNGHQESSDGRSTSPAMVPISSDWKAKSLELEDEIDQVLLALRMSQESEYKLAEERLYAQKKYLQNLYQQLQKEKSELARHLSKTSADGLLSAVSDRLDQIRRELAKLKDMEQVANGFGMTSKGILKELFGLETE